MRCAFILGLAALLPSGAAHAAAIAIAPGALGDALSALSRQAGASISLAETGAWDRRVAGVSGSMSTGTALKRLLAGSGLRAEQIGRKAWRIVPEPRRVRAAPRPAAKPASAVADDGQDIVVIASKRDVRLRDFAGSVSIVDQSDLTFGGERGMESVIARLASLTSTHLGAGRNKLFIRGIADSSFTGPTQATVGQYLGDMRLTYNAPDPDLRLYDVRSVEVLEGPQGTLYGAGSLGGIIRIVPNSVKVDRIEGALSGGLSATQHGAPGGDLGGVVNAPLVDGKLGLRLVGYAIQDGGYIDDVLRRRSDINRTRIAGGRASLRAVIDGWSVELGGVFQDNHGRDSQYADRDLPPLSRASNVDGGFDADYGVAQIIIGKTWDGLSFLSSTGLVRQNLDERYDATAQGGPPQLFVQSNRTRMFATENRLWRPTRNGFGWVLGASFTQNRTDLDRSIETIGPGGASSPLTGVANRIREATAYGEASFEALPGLTLTGGARYTHARLSGGAEDVMPAFTPIAELARAAIVASRTETSFLPSAAVSAAILPKLLLFARYQEGFRPGGLAIESGFVRRFRRDQVATMETGLRYGERGRDPIDLSISVSATQWDNIQADFVDATGLPSTDNIGDGRIYSVGFALGWQPVAGLTLDAAAAYNDSRITDPSPSLVRAFAVALANVTTDPAQPGTVVPISPTREAMGRIPNVARFTGRIGADYRREIRDGIEFRINGWARYIGKSRLGIGPTLGQYQGDYVDTALNARIGRADFGVTLGVTNLTDTIGNRFALGTPFATGSGRQITPLRPRTIRLGLDRTF